MADESEHTPSFDLPRPESSRDIGMAERIARKMFGDAAEVESDASGRIAHFEILQRVGAGGMGVVYSGRDLDLGRTVALKLVRRRAMTEASQERLLREAKVLAKLSHPNVVSVYEVGRHEDAVYIAMELVEGETLLRWQSRDGRTSGEIVDAYRQAAAGLSAAHDAGVFHRDFKPANVLVGADARVRVVDFGLAVEVEASEVATASPDGSGERTPASRRVAGTPGYVAPELLDGRPADGRSDQFALCVALWEALAGERPYSAESLARGDAGRSVPSGSVAPRWLRRVLVRGLAWDPAERWPSLAVLAERLNPRPRRQRSIFGGLLGVGVLVGSIVGSSVNRLPERECREDGLAAFDAVWSGGRQRALEARFEAVAPDWGPRAAAQLREARTEHRDAWRHAHLELCWSGRRSTKRAAVLDCFDGWQTRADDLLGGLADADGPVLARLPSQLDVLPSPHTCLAAERARTPRERALERRVDRAELDIASGRYPEAEKQLELPDLAAPDEWGTLDVQRQLLLSRALSLRASIEAYRKDGAAADGFVRAAYVAAEIGADPSTRFELHLQMGHVALELLDEPERAEWYRQLSEAALGSRGETDRARVLAFESAIAARLGDLERAESLLRESIGMLESTDARVLADSMTLELANVLAEQGSESDANVLYTEVLEARRRELGRRHPDVATVEFDLGLTALSLGETERGYQLLEGSLDDLVTWSRPDSVRLAEHRVALASAIIAGEEPELDAALNLAASAVVDDPYPGAYTAHTNGLRQAGWLTFQTWRLDDLAHLYGRLATRGALAPGELEEIAQSLAWVACRQGRVEDVYAMSERALATSDPAIRVGALLTLAEVELARDLDAEALARLESIAAEVEAVDDPLISGEYEAVLAVALGRTRGRTGEAQGHRERGRALLEGEEMLILFEAIQAETAR